MSTKINVEGRRLVKNDKIAEIGQGGGAEYTAGTGIDITEDVISVDNTIATKSEVEAVDDKVIPTYGLQLEDAKQYDLRNGLPYTFAQLIAAGMPILSTTDSDSESTYPDAVVTINKGDQVNLTGFYAIKRQDGNGYHVFLNADTSSNKISIWTTMRAIKGTTRIYELMFCRASKSYVYDSAGTNAHYVLMVGTNIGNVCASGETADSTNDGIKFAIMPIVVPQAQIGTRYDQQVQVPTADGTYTLKVTVASGKPTFSWTLDQA